MSDWVTAWAMAHTNSAIFGLKLGGRTSCIKILCPIGGTKARICLSNRYGTSPVTVSGAALCINKKAVKLCFGGKEGAVIMPQCELRSDEAELVTAAGDIVEVRLYFADGQIIGSGNVLLPACHSALGNYSLSESFTAEDSDIWAFEKRPFELSEPVTILSALDVLNASGSYAAAVLGDSNTIGGHYTRPLTEKLKEHGIALLNLGISGNRLLCSSAMVTLMGVFGQAAKERIDWDIFGHFGIKTVLLNVGGNDIFQPGTFAADISELCTAEALFAQNEALAKRCREKGLRVMGATLVPFAGADGYSKNKQEIADEFNALMRSSEAFDDIIDFNRILADPENPAAYLQEFDSSDHLHFSAKGGEYAADNSYKYFL